MRPLDWMTPERGVNYFYYFERKDITDLLKNCWFFTLFDLQNSNFMWFKFIILWGNSHRLRWAMRFGSLMLARFRCVRSGCELQWLPPRVRQPQRRGCKSGLSLPWLVQSGEIPCWLPDYSKWSIDYSHVNNENNSKGNYCCFPWPALASYCSSLDFILKYCFGLVFRGRRNKRAFILLKWKSSFKGSSLQELNLFTQKSPNRMFLLLCLDIY